MKNECEATLFSGEVKHSEWAYPNQIVDISGNHQVVRVTSVDDVAKAVGAVSKLANAGIPVWARSGEQAHFGNTEDKDKLGYAVIDDAAGGVVIDVRSLNCIEVNGNSVRVEPGAKNSDIAQQLAWKGLALPLGSSNNQSFASVALTGGCNPLIRSLGPLQINSVQAVEESGCENEYPSVEAFQRSAISGGSSGAIATGFSMEAGDVSKLWMVVFTVVLPDIKTVKKLAARLLSCKVAEDWADVDIALRVHPMRSNIPCLSVRIAGGSTAHMRDAEQVLKNAAKSVFGLKGNKLADSLSWHRGVDVQQALIEHDQPVSEDPSIQSQKFSEHHFDDDCDESRDVFIADALEKYFIAWGSAESGSYDALHPNGWGALNAPELCRDVCLQLGSGKGLCLQVVSHRTADLKPLNKAAAEDKNATDAPSLELCDQGNNIDGFEGGVYRSTDANPTRYNDERGQYAKSSIGGWRTSPALFCMPLKDEGDEVKNLRAAVRHAKKECLSVSVRSGGHQYAGLSSGGAGAMVVMMDHFNDVKFIPGYDDCGERVAPRLVVGPAVTLGTLITHSVRHGVAVPHGECSFVGLGGHGQTGGYGHMSRGFGFFQDRIESFKILLADGSCRTVYAPEYELKKSQQQNGEHPLCGGETDDLFWAVLGGNAGSFGIIYEYTLVCFEDCDATFRGSNRYISIQEFHKDRYMEVVKTFQSWTKAAKDERGSKLPSNEDLFVTTISGSDPISLDIIAVSHTRGGREQNIFEQNPKTKRLHLREVMTKTYPNNVDAASRPVFPVDIVAPMKPSILSANSVRSSYIMPRGQEFLMPFVKSIHCTHEYISDDFVEGLVKLTAKVMGPRGREMGLRLSSELWVGGAKYEDPFRRDAEPPQQQQVGGSASRTALPHRSTTFGFTFDIFYGCPRSRRYAEKYHRKVQRLVKNEFYGKNKPQHRMFWGTFGEYPYDYDMTEYRVQKRYYDDKKVFAKLQRVKAHYDPSDLFHTVMTVPPCTKKCSKPRLSESSAG